MDIKSLSPVVTATAVAARPAISAPDAAATNGGMDSALAANASLTNVAALNSKSGADNQGLTDRDRNGTVKLSKQDLQDITEGLNDFMVSMNTDIKFVLHTKMKELVVQVVDTKTHKVLRESPPKEILDTLARIRDFVGALLDKKA